MIKNLLVPLDGTELSERAMTQSIDLARQLGAAIVGFVAEPDMPLPNMSTNPYRYQRDAAAHTVAGSFTSSGVRKAGEAGVGSLPSVV